VARETELGGIEEFTAKNDKNVQLSELVWLLTISDEVNLNSQNIYKKVDKLNAGSLSEKKKRRMQQRRLKKCAT